MTLPEHLQDRYEEERAARAEADPVERDNDDLYDTVDKPDNCPSDEECSYPLCDCWMDSDD